MAETAKDPIKASDIPDSEVVDAADPTSTTAEQEAVANLQNNDGAAAEDPIKASDVRDDTANSATDPTGTTVEEKVADDASTSPDNKRKDPPVSISAHERNDRNSNNNNKRQRGGYNNNNRSSRIKTRFEDQPESSDPDEIRRQVEFYFSDSNLPIDAYLLNETGGHQNRPVPLKVIHNFKRMRHFQPFAAVRDAVKESKFLELDERDEIRRKVPLSDKFTDDPQQNRGLVHSSSMARSIYAKGFGEETRTTHLDIEAFFAPYGPVNAVRLRRHDDGEFKGSVFVEFADEDTMKQFLELEPKPTWGDEEKELEIMSKQEYVDMKHQGILDGTVKPKSTEGNYRGGRGGRGGRRGHDRRGSKEHYDKDDWKSRRDRDQDRDRRGGRGRGRGRGNDRGGRRGGGRRSSPDYDHRRENRRDDDDDEVKDRAELPEGDAGAGAPEADMAENKEAKAEVKANGEARATENGGEDAAPPAAGAKKRAREEGGEDGAGEAKRAKDETAAA